MIGSWWTLHPKTSPNTNLLQTLTDVRPQPLTSLRYLSLPMLLVFINSIEWEKNGSRTSCLSDSFGSAFEFVRNSSRPKRPLLRDMMGSGKFGRNAAESRSAESSPVEFNGKSLEMQLCLQSQQEEVCRMQQEQAKLKEELVSQKVRKD